MDPPPTGVLCQVQFLDGAELCYDVNRTCTGQYLLQHIFDQLELKESIYFGLQYQQESQFKWLEADKSLKKQLSNFSKLKRVHFYFRVKYYPPAPGRCEQEFTRYLFYLQIKLDLYSKKLPCADTTLEQLCALGLQAELGDFDPYRMGDFYVQQFRFIPNTTPQFMSTVSRLHQTKQGIPPGQAENQFLCIVTTLDYYGMNCCSARRINAPIQIAVSHIGVCLFEKRILHEVFPWRNIIRLGSRRNKFKLVARHHRTGKKTDLEFKLVNSRICKDFWCLCRDYHAFFTGEMSLIHPAFHTPSVPLRHTPSTSSNVVAHTHISPPSPSIDGIRQLTGTADTNTTSLASSPPKPRYPPAFIHANSVQEQSSVMRSKVRPEVNRSTEALRANDGDTRSRTDSFGRAIDRDSLTPRSQDNAVSPAHSSLPVNSQILTPPFINQYEELDKLEESMSKNIEKPFVKKRSLNELPPPIPIRSRTSSVGIHKTEIPGLLPNPFFTPNPSSHGISATRPMRPQPPFVAKPIRATAPLHTTHQLSPLTPTGNAIRSLQYPSNDLDKIYSNSTSELAPYSVPRYKQSPPGYRQPPLIRGSAGTPPSQLPASDTQTKDSCVVEGSQFTMATRSLSVSSASNSNSSTSREANYEPGNYNVIQKGDTQLLKFLHNRQESMESNNYYQTVPAREEIRLLLRSDPEGRYGFNIQGKERNQEEPVIVTKVLHESPASQAHPTPLMVGDELKQVNNHSVQIFSHHQLVKFIQSGKDLQKDGLELVVRRRKNKSSEIITFLQSEFPNQGMTPVDGSRHFHSISATEVLQMPMRSLSRSSINQTPSALAPKNLSSLTLPQSIELIKQCLADGSSIDSFLAIPPQPTNPPRTMLAARYPDNFKKNRYKDILPYDETRIQLTIEADYINASLIEVCIDSSKKEKKFYVVTQGPLKHTCKDFWCMVWDQGCTLIVMLTSLKEGGKNKCCRYWPELAATEVSEKTMHYEGIEVTTMEEHKENIFTRRKLRLRHQLHSGERFITQLHYTAWPDQGVPAETDSFLSFVNVVRREGKETVPVIHCSAGIGRSGVHIVVDVAISLMERGLPVDIVGIIWQLRECRSNMVQNLAQYDFVCRAVLAAYSPPIHGNTAPQIYKV